MRRHIASPRFGLSIWKADGKLWFAEAADLKAAIDSSGVDEIQIQKRMGHGYHYIQDILDGKRIDGWAIVHIEYGISNEK